MPATAARADFLARLAEATAAEEARQRADEAARAARAALAQVLRQQGDLVAELDRENARQIELALARVLAQLAAAPTDYELWVLPRMAEGIRRIAEELAASVAAQASSGLARAWALGVQGVAAPLVAEQLALNPVGPNLTAARPAPPAPGAAPAAPPPPPAVPTLRAAPTAGLGQADLRQLRATQVFTTELIKGATEDTAKAINRALGQVVLGTSTPAQAMQQVAKLLPTKAPHQVRGIVTSQLAAAFNSASFNELRRRAALDPALKKQWRRSGKRHSRWNHDLADGQVQEVGRPFELVAGSGKAGRPGKGGSVKIMFPADPAAPLGETINCGCVALAWKASWKMKNPAGRPMTDEERARRDAPRKRPPAAPVAPATPQQRALAAFKAPTHTDVTGQALRVDERLFPASLGDARLVRQGRDLASYYAVQGIKRPTEVWQQEAVDMRTGEVLRTRLFLKRFDSGGQAWLGQARFAWDGTAWAPTGPWQAQPVGGGVEQALSRLRAGARVWPKRGGNGRP